MFFLGISAHLIIYLLVPAFLVVCLYFNGTLGSPEVATLLPEVITYEPATVRQISGDTYFYYTEQRIIKPKGENSIPEFFSLPFLIVPYSFFYLSPALISKALRAPPIF